MHRRRQLALLLAGVVFASAHAATCTVAVDIGHSRAHPGATSARGVDEWQFNAALARVVVPALAARGMLVAVINPAGDDWPLEQRTRAAQAAGAQLLLSLHHDAVQPQYLSSWTWNGREQRYSDAFHGYGLFIATNAQQPRSLLAATLLGDALRQRGFAPSLHHAEPIAGEGRTLLDRGRGIYRFDELVVLREALMPAVLLEAGVIVHRDEEREMTTPAVQGKIAAAVASAAQAYCKSIKGPPS